MERTFGRLFRLTGVLSLSRYWKTIAYDGRGMSQGGWGGWRIF